MDGDPIGGPGPAIDVFFISVVATARPASSTSQGDTIDVFYKSVVTTTGLTGSTPRGPPSTSSSARWWLLPDPSVAPPRGPAIDVFYTSGVAAVELTGSTSRRPAIDLQQLGGGRCQTHRQHPQGGAIDIF
jgi:hypothetical protein